MTLAEEIKAYRAKHILTQEEFGKMCDVGVVTICKVEKGEAYSFLTEAKIKKVLESEGEING